MESQETRQARPKISVAAATVAFLLAAVSLYEAFGNPVLAFVAAIPLVAGIGILRRRVWSAYGFALVQLSQALLLLILSGNNGGIPLKLILSESLVAVALATLFVAAGRSMEGEGARRGYAFPWIALACLVTAPFFFVRIFVIPTGAMENTLLIGDRILVQVFPHHSFQFGDLVAFHYPVDRRLVFVKRIIGVGGDRIRLVSKTVYRNGAPLSEPYAIHVFPTTDAYRDNWPPGRKDLVPLVTPGLATAMPPLQVVNGDAIVPPNQFFVLGDNRDNSLDSRYWGFLKSTDLVDLPLLICNSQQKESATGKSHIRWNRLFKPLWASKQF